MMFKGPVCYALEPNIWTFGLVVECLTDVWEVTTFGDRSVGSYVCQSMAADGGVIFWIQWLIGWLAWLGDWLGSNLWCLVDENTSCVSVPNYSYRPQRSCGQGYVFTRVCDSVHRGVSRQGEPPPPPTRQTPPRTRQTPNPQDQADPHPPDQADPPPGRETPPDRQTPPGQGAPPGPGRPPPREADSRIRSTSGRYASYWNAFLLSKKVNLFDQLSEFCWTCKFVKYFKVISFETIL